MSNQEINLEEQAESLLEDWARRKKTSLRSLGIMDRYRRAVVRRREIPLSSVIGGRHRTEEGEG